MFLFLLCSLSSWLCQIPAPPIVPPVVTAQVPPEQDGHKEDWIKWGIGEAYK